MARPSAFAVLRLITNSNCWLHHRQVRRFGALENLVNVDATSAKVLRMPTCFDPDSAPTRRARCRITCFDDAPFVIDEL